MHTPRLVFEAPVDLDDEAYGKGHDGWVPVCRARALMFSPERAGESVEAGRLSGAARYKVRLWSSLGTRRITTECRAQDEMRGAYYNVREVDALSSPTFVFLVIESGVAI